jgi:hypothetical protein
MQLIYRGQTYSVAASAKPTGLLCARRYPIPVEV